mmetsp:Transcript_47159/g.151343  ORF Transcript_47159/g.151343 Transcript_47159/m.151343 type:complete len:200 (+) Transcript_47159:111-710(+)
MGQRAGLLQGCETCTSVRREPQAISGGSITKEPSQPSSCPAAPTLPRDADGPLCNAGVGHWDDFFQVCDDIQPANVKSVIATSHKGVGKPLLKDKHRGKQLDPDLEALLAAAQFGSVDSIKRILHGTIDVSGADRNGWTALHWAAQEGHLDACGELLRSRADVSAVTLEGWTPLQAAQREDHLFAQKLSDLINNNGVIN